MARPIKDSGIEWIGEIPEEWKKGKITRIFSLIGSGTTPKSTDGTQFEGNINWIQSGDINGGKLTACKNSITVETLNLYSALEVYTAPFIIVAMYGASVGNMSISKIDGCVNQACCVLGNCNSDFKYSFYALKAAKEHLIQKAVGGGQPNIRQDTIKSLWIPQPTLAEQHRIASYLDHQCAAIDAVLEKTRASIEEYKKLKQAVITQAVTKGVRGDRPMKDSGVEWIGEIPEEWDLRKAKYCISITNGSDPKTSGDVPVYGSGAASFKTCGEFKEGPTVLIGRKGATLHIPHYIEGRYWNVDTAFDVHVIGNYDLRFYYYCAGCFDYKFYVSQTTLPGMTQTNYENMFLPVPEASEQREIVEHLDQKCAEIDALIAKKNAFLTELEAYKKSLIYEYVTGKKEVPHGSD